jgi:hypothetical protein
MYVNFPLWKGVSMYPFVGLHFRSDVISPKNFQQCNIVSSIW